MTLVARAVRLALRRGYRVLPDGRVRAPSGRIRRTPRTALGRTTYLRFTIKMQGRSVSVPVHRLAGFQLFGERALRRGMMVRHIDGDSHNCRLDNLALGRNRENMLDLGSSHLSRIGRRGNRLKQFRRRAG